MQFTISLSSNTSLRTSWHRTTRLWPRRRRTIRSLPHPWKPSELIFRKLRRAWVVAVHEVSVKAFAGWRLGDATQVLKSETGANNDGPQEQRRQQSSLQRRRVVRSSGCGIQATAPTLWMCSVIYWTRPRPSSTTLATPIQTLLTISRCSSILLRTRLHNSTELFTKAKADVAEFTTSLDAEKADLVEAEKNLSASVESQVASEHEAPVKGFVGRWKRWPCSSSLLRTSLHNSTGPWWKRRRTWLNSRRRWCWEKPISWRLIRICQLRWRHKLPAETVASKWPPSTRLAWRALRRRW